MNILAGALLGAVGGLSFFWYVVCPIIPYLIWRNHKWCRLGHRTLRQWYRAHLRSYPFGFRLVERRLSEETGPEYFH